MFHNMAQIELDNTGICYMHNQERLSRYYSLGYCSLGYYSQDTTHRILLGYYSLEYH
jgi:hypothetical protein